MAGKIGVLMSVRRSCAIARNRSEQEILKCGYLFCPYCVAAACCAPHRRTPKKRFGVATDVLQKWLSSWRIRSWLREPARTKKMGRHRIRQPLAVVLEGIQRAHPSSRGKLNERAQQARRTFGGFRRPATWVRNMGTTEMRGLIVELKGERCEVHPSRSKPCSRFPGDVDGLAKRRQAAMMAHMLPGGARVLMRKGRPSQMPSRCCGSGLQARCNRQLKSAFTMPVIHVAAMLPRVGAV